MNTVRRHPEKGSLILVVLCLLAVLGIALASFLAIGNQSMKLSNRSSRTGMSEQLAEMGLEEALRAYNSNNWSTWTANGTTATWSTSGTTASCTITFPAAKFGQGVTGTVSIRVDNYNANQLTSAWVNGTSYRLNDKVSYGGAWYNCVRTTSSQAPNGFANMAYWVPVPIPSVWDSTITYKTLDVVYYAPNNAWYRCILAPTANQSPSNSTYWTSISKISLDSGYSAINREILMYYGTWYYYNSGWYPMPTYTPIVAWCWQSGYSYSYNDLVFYGASETWYRCISPHTSSGSIVPTNTSYWENALSSSWAWSSSETYNLNDVVYRSGSFYRCILAHSNQGPPNATYWSTAPLKSNTWDSGRQYSLNDTVYYNGLWYRCTNANNGSNPASSGNWSSTANSPWSSSGSYNAGSSYVSYGGVWYACILAPTANQSPNNSTYWSALGAPVVYAEGRVTLPDGSPTIKTQLRGTLAPAPLFPNAIAATQAVVINGGGLVDSYDSTSSDGYNGGSGSTVGYSAVLAATGTTNPAVTVTSTTVNGYVAVPPASTSPYAPMWSYGGSAVLTGSGSSGIALTRVSRSPSIPQFDIHSVRQHTALPDTSTWPAGGITIGTPGAATPSIYYYAGNLNLNNSTNYILTIKGPVILDIRGNLHLSSSGKITIAGTGSAEIHVSGRLQLDSSSSGIDNQTLDPKKCTILSTASSGTQNVSFTTQPFYGAIYMPGATLTIDNGEIIFGALSAQNITFTGDANVHYDTSLRYAVIPGVDQPWSITQWRELTDPNDRAVLP